MRLPSIKDAKNLKDLVNEKAYKIFDNFTDVFGINPLDLTSDDRNKIMLGVINGIDDNVLFGALQFLAFGTTPPDWNYYYMRSKSFTDSMFASAYTVASVYSVAGAVQAFIDAGAMGALAIAASPTVAGGAALGAGTVEELARGAVLSGVSFLSDKMSKRSMELLNQTLLT